MRSNLKWERASHNSAGEPPPVIAAATTGSLELQLMELENDRAVLKGLNAISDKIEHKRSVLIPKYRPQVEAWLESGVAEENPIFSEMVIWFYDTGDMETFMAWVLKAIELALPTPERFKRDWQTFCADSVFDWADAQVKEGNAIDPYFTQVMERIHEGEWRVFERVSAKLYKLGGQYLLRDELGNVNVPSVGSVETLEKALAMLTKANDLHSKIGVGDLIKNRIPARIRALREGTNL
ncbi:terminase [Enterovibrio nigricans]|nr:terminase [Enterovibrio nigricans]